MKRILSLFLALLFALLLTSCTSDEDIYEMPSEAKPLSSSEIQNETLKSLIDDGRLVSQIESDLPTTLGLIREISEKAEYSTTYYDELPAKVRNISKYFFDNFLETVPSKISYTGSYVFVKIFETSYSDRILMVFDDSNRVYRVMMFNEDEKCYSMYRGEYTDFSNEYFYKNKKYAKLACPYFIVIEETNETLMGRYTFPISDSESVDVIHNESGEMLFCCDKTEKKTEYFDNNFYSITEEESEKLREEFVDRIKREYKADILL